MEELYGDFEALKVATIRKSIAVTNYVRSVNMGPHSTLQIQLHRDLKPATQELKKTTRNPIVSAKFNPFPPQKAPQQKELENERAVVGANINPFSKPVHMYEQQRQQQLQDAINKRVQQMAHFDRQQQQNKAYQWHNKQHMLLQKMQQQEVYILSALEEHDRDSSREQEKITQYHLELAERRKEHDRVIKAQQERNTQHKRKQINLLIDKIMVIQQEFRTIYLEIIQILKDATEEIKASLAEHKNTFKSLPSQIDEIVQRCKAASVNEHDLTKCTKLLQYAKQIRDEIRSKVMEHFKLKEKLLKEQLDEQARIKEAATVTVEVVKPEPPKITAFIQKGSLESYAELQQFLKRHEETYKQLSDDPHMKDFKFNLKKAINIPVNAISAVNSNHLEDKYNKIHALLSGKVVKIGDAQISASKHPQGVPFCMGLLAKKLVLQGDLMVSSNPDAAFCYASVIIALWNDFPDFGKLVMAHFHKECPYLVPFYFPRTVEQSDEDYYKSLGYQYKEGAVEKQDKFLKRMTGLFRLYFAIFVAHPKRGHAENPHGLDIAWRWLANILNMEPRLDITATALHTFLEVAGSAMVKTYGKQFVKVVGFIMGTYMELLKKIDTGGPVTRLEGLIQEYVTTRRFDEPKGTLPAGFW